MKCPKCHYLSFEPEPRCRNCGYDLATPDADAVKIEPDPLIKGRDAEGPLADFDLRRPSQADVRPAANLGPIRPRARPRRPARRPPTGRQSSESRTLPSKGHRGTCPASPSPNGARRRLLAL